MRVFEETPGEPEVPLAGGDVTEGVVRVGGTVRRPPTPFTPAIRALLAHLEAAGFEGAPRPLGVDAAGREVLTFLPGRVPPRPLPGWAAADRVLAGVARLQRRYHDAAASFVPPPGAVWDAPPDPRELPPMEIAPELIGHCDVTPDNVVFRDTPDGPEPWGLIDFDLAKPSSRLLDIVTTLRHWAPLSDPADRVPSLAGLDAGLDAGRGCSATPTASTWPGAVRCWTWPTPAWSGPGT
jgi:hypothetical protein